MATINGVEVIGDKTAHDYDLLDKNDGINLANGVERNREATEDNHQDIVLHRTDTDVHVTPAWKNSLVTKEILGLYWTAAQTADIINEISIAGGAKLVKVDVLPETGLEQTIYLVPKTDPQAGDIFNEYVWIDGKYEFIGTTKADLSGYFPITGGALTGNIIERNTDSDHLGISGSYWGHGAYLWLSGQNSGYAGAWYLSARDTEKSCDLVGSPSGVLSWGGKLVLTEDDLANYATKAELNAKQDALSAQQIQNIADVTNKANDADVVHKSGNESINGDKTFTSSVKLKSNTIDNTVTPTTNLFKNLYVTDKNDVALSSLYYAQRTTNNREFNLQVSHPNSNDILNLNLVHNGSRRSVVFQGDDFVSNLINSNLGTSSNKWKTINGINPGALSLPSAPEQYSVIVDTTSWQDSWAWNSYSSTMNGVLMVKLSQSDGCLCVAGDNAGVGILMGNNHPGITFSEEFFTFPIVANKSYNVLFRGTLSSVRFYANAGNV